MGDFTSTENPRAALEEMSWPALTLSTRVAQVTVWSSVAIGLLVFGRFAHLLPFFACSSRSGRR